MPQIDSPLAGKDVMITGGTGSFGKAFIKIALESLDPARLIVFSRDELKQYDLRSLYPNEDRLRFFIGDVRDRQRLRRAMDGVGIVVHAAALKQVDTAEYNPFECIQTNVLGAQNVIDAAIDSGVERVVALSTDKASSPVNLYGASKLCADKLFIAGNHYAAHSRTRMSVVRYGNVIGSRGSVVPFFKQLAHTGRLPITDKRMTRFWITLAKAVNLVVNALSQMNGGELYVPKIPSMRIVDLADAIAPHAELYEIGIRPGEKLHEEMISVDDARRTIEFENHYIIQPLLAGWSDKKLEPATGLPDGFSYSSATNDRWLSVEDLRVLVDDEAN
jgi:UDP-N-acetylglucosamine 4,6-dehydratase